MALSTTSVVESNLTNAVWSRTSQPTACAFSRPFFSHEMVRSAVSPCRSATVTRSTRSSSASARTVIRPIAPPPPSTARCTFATLSSSKEAAARWEHRCSSEKKAASPSLGLAAPEDARLSAQGDAGADLQSLAILVVFATAVFARVERTRLGRGSAVTESPLVDISAAAIRLLGHG